jgi:hypothetical protein
MGNKIDRQIELLRDSVEKWHDVVAGKLPTIGNSDCPLCIEYHVNSNCEGCPLHEQGEEFYCYTIDGIYHHFFEDKSRENAEEMVNMLEYMVDLYEIKRIHDES